MPKMPPGAVAAAGNRQRGPVRGTVRPGMENLSKAQIEAQQAPRVQDIRVEIQKNFVDKIFDLLGK
ncbi:hypothetical protein [Janthinobacterium fluminis]|uniref:hypothetical protein n=1 Tax=Janthinobacterium fluminis TaxID=2987524 RepID=UPI002358A179|nr:hypothetical protein [Janthinobacterium fluminis]